MTGDTHQACSGWHTRERGCLAGSERVEKACWGRLTDPALGHCAICESAEVARGVADSCSAREQSQHGRMLQRYPAVARRRWLARSLGWAWARRGESHRRLRASARGSARAPPLRTPAPEREHARPTALHIELYFIPVLASSLIAPFALLRPSDWWRHRRRRSSSWSSLSAVQPSPICLFYSRPL